jgi:extradiol dioxygenase family protein
MALPLRTPQRRRHRLRNPTPVIRFPDEPGEQRTMFFRDPSGNPIEIKGFRDFEGVFAR